MASISHFAFHKYLQNTQFLLDVYNFLDLCLPIFLLFYYVLHSLLLKLLFLKDSIQLILSTAYNLVSFRLCFLEVGPCLLILLHCHTFLKTQRLQFFDCTKFSTLQLKSIAVRILHSFFYFQSGLDCMNRCYLHPSELGIHAGCFYSNLISLLFHLRIALASLALRILFQEAKTGF